VPHLIRRSQIRRTISALVGGALLSVAIPAVADACTISTGGSPVFSSFGDNANYLLLQNGSFEAGTSGWLLTGSAVVGGNESFYLNSPSDSHALMINPTGVAVSPDICVGIETPTFRFVARRTSGTWAQMNVNLLWTDSAGVSHTTTVGSISGTTAWAVTPALKLGTTLPLWQSSSTLTVRIQFVPANYGGTWRIDDVYVDPYRKG
jgi:hypothetical protein